MSYYVVVKDFGVLLGEEGLLRIPSYILDRFVMDDARRDALERAFRFVVGGENVLIVGRPGTGKTALMAVLLKRLVDSGYSIAYIREGTPSISKEHEELGIILFYDDLPRMNISTLSSIFKNNVRGIVATARIEEISLVAERTGFDLYGFFRVIEVTEMPPEKLREMLLSYADAEGISIADREAIDVVVSKASGLPIYIWQVIRELRIRGEPLTLAFANTIPRGMYEYVDDILWRAIGSHEDRYETLVTLLCMTDFLKYLVNQDLYNAVFVLAKEKIKRKVFGLDEALYSDVLDKISRYLARDRATFSFRLPHDSWADVLRGASSGPMSAEISKINMLFPKSRRREIIIEAARRTWHEVLMFVEDERRRRAFLENIRLNLGEEILRDIMERPLERERVPVVMEARPESLIMRQLRDYLRLGDAGIDMAFQLAGRLIEGKIEDPAMLNSVAAVFLAKGIRSNDKSLIERAVDILSNLSTHDAKYNLAIAYYHLERFEDAEKLFRELYEKHGDKDSLLNLGITLLRLGRFSEAIKVVRKYVELTSDPRGVRLLNRLSRLGIAT